MTEPIRLSLAVSTEPRDASNQDKDSLLKNCFIDKDPTGVTYVTKRPGFLISSEAITTGLTRGIYINPNTVNDYSYTNPLVWYTGSNTGTGMGGLRWYIGGIALWDNSTSYNINDPVAYDDGTGPAIYYSAAPSNVGVAPSTTTAPGNAYWSTTSLGSARYYGTWAGSNGPTCGSKGAAGYAAFIAFCTNTSCASNIGGTWRTYAGVGYGPNVAADDRIQTNNFNWSPTNDCTSSNPLGLDGSTGFVTTIP